MISKKLDKTLIYTYFSDFLEQGGLSQQSGGFEAQGINPSSYPSQGQGSGTQGAESPGPASYAGQNGGSETPQGAFGVGAGAAGPDQSTGKNTYYACLLRLIRFKLGFNFEWWY